MKKLLALTVGSMLLCGCQGYGTISKNLSKDGAILWLDVNSPWGKQKAIRVGDTTNTVEITTDGDITINGKKK